jgi:FkbM family methyltransferase
MNFVSYAQNFEDVMLWRALKHVAQGCYVDIGAQHPLVDSVSQAFYQHGWRGVHVEPVSHYASLLRADRPDETVLQVALGAQEGVIELNVIADTGLSTAVAEYAQLHQQHGFATRTELVPVLTMRTALQSLAGKQVHWLKIDVEGFEEQVLRGWDSSVLRPWILVVEATVPTSEEVRFAHWEPLVAAAGYHFAYFDGLNRFYVAAEHPELMAAFASPPNVFDAARLSGLASSELCRGIAASHTQALDEAAGPGRGRGPVRCRNRPAA